MFLVTVDERNGEFEYTHHMLLPTVDGISDKELIEDFYGEGSTKAWEAPKGFYWVFGEVLARVQSIKPLTDDEAATLIKFI
jgi:hypothetical protein